MMTMREKVREILSANLDQPNDEVAKQLRAAGFRGSPSSVSGTISKVRYNMKHQTKAVAKKVALPADQTPTPQPTPPAAPKITEGMMLLLSGTMQVVNEVGGTDNVRRVLSLVTQVQQVGITSPDGVIAVLDKTLELVDTLQPKPPATP